MGDGSSLKYVIITESAVWYLFLTASFIFSLILRSNVSLMSNWKSVNLRMSKKKPKKKRQSKYDKKLAITGSLDEVLKASAQKPVKK